MLGITSVKEVFKLKIMEKNGEHWCEFCGCQLSAIPGIGHLLTKSCPSCCQKKSRKTTYQMAIKYKSRMAL